MITLHLEAESPALLIDDLKKMFNLVEAPQASAAGDITTEDLQAHLAAEGAAPPAAKKTRAKKGETAEVKKAVVGEAPTEPAAAPAFLAATEEKKAEAEPEMSLDDMRAAASKLAEANGMDAVAKVLKTFKGENGEPAAKMSQVLPGDRAKAAAAFEAAIAKKD